MPRSASTFLGIAILSALLGSGGIAGLAGGSASLLLWCLLVLFLVGTVVLLLAEERELTSEIPAWQRHAAPPPPLRPTQAPMKQRARSKQRVPALQGFLPLLALASAWETGKGAGRDVENAGEALEDAAG